MNIGEEICGEWLRHVKKCDFIQYNLQTPDEQGEIDVIGINLADRVVYVCEVAVHLVTGLQYVRNGQPDNVPRLVAKFRKDIKYARKALPDYAHVFMLWSPVVRDQRAGSVHNQLADTRHVAETMKAELNADIELIVNERFAEALATLRAVSRHQTKELDSTVMRLLQVEEHLARHLKRLSSATPPTAQE